MTRTPLGLFMIAFLTYYRYKTQCIDQTHSAIYKYVTCNCIGGNEIGFVVKVENINGGQPLLLADEVGCITCVQSQWSNAL